MKIWKQALVSLVILVAAVLAWAKFVPGGAEMLATWGIDLPAILRADASTPQQGTPGQQGAQSQGQSGQRRNQTQLPVIAAEVTRETINNRLSAIGTGRARQSVVVVPFSAGRMTEILVASGATVAAGDVIARLDSESETIAVDRAKFALDDAIARQERIGTLRASNTATRVQVTEAALAVDNARLALRDAELALERRSITAPIAGVVGILPVAAGNFVSTTTEIARIDDRSDILVDFWVPERYASIIRVGQPLTASSVARPADRFSGTISAIDNRIDVDSRTLQVQARIQNPDDALRAGMSFQVTMEFPGDTYPAVNPLAVQWGSGGAFVWLVRDGVAARTEVRVIQRNTDTVLVDAPLQPGDIVVTEGIHAVRDGAPVLVSRVEGRAEQPPAASADARPSGS